MADELKRLIEPVESIALEEAAVCVDCEQITRRRNGHCRACGSEAILNLAGLVGRLDRADRARLVGEPESNFKAR